MKLLRSWSSRGFAAKLARCGSSGLLITILLAPTVAAQEWMGVAGFGVEVKSGRGGALQQAVVTLAYRGVFDEEAVGGPAPRATDSKGRVSFSNLALGTWSLRVEHPDHLSYVATVQLSRREKPQVASSFLEASGSGRKPIRVKLVKAQGRDLGTPLPAARESAPPLPAAPSKQPAKAPIETEPKAPIDAPVEAPAQTELEAPIDAPIDEPAETEPETPIDAPAPMEAPPEAPKEAPGEAPIDVPTPTPAPPKAPQKAPVEVPMATPPEPPREAPTRAAREAPAEAARETPVEAPLEAPKTEPKPREPEVEPSRPELPAPPQQPTPEPPPRAADIEPSAPPPAPEPEPSAALQPPAADAPPATTVETPEPDPSPDSMPLSDLLADLPEGSITSYRQRTCLECKPGEWGATSMVAAAATTAGGCPADALDRAEASVEALARHFGSGLRDFAGPLLRDPQDPLLSGLPDDNRLEVERSIGAFLRPDSSCRLLILVFPKRARISGFRFEALEGGRSADCNGAEPCPIGSARWLALPGIERSAGATFTWALFENRSPDTERRARITGYFAAVGGWRPSGGP